MSIIRKLFSLFQKDDELYVPGYGNEYLKHATENKIFIRPGLNIGSLPTVKKELSEAILNNNPEKVKKFN